MAFVLEKDEEVVDEAPKGRFVLEKEEKPIKSLRQKGAEAILSTIGPGADVAKGLTRGGAGFLGSLVDLASSVGPYLGDLATAVGPYLGGAGASKTFSPERTEAFQQAFGSEGLKEKLGQFGVTAPETALGRFGERLGGYGPFAMSPAALIGAGAGQVAQELGAPEGVQLLAELLAPLGKTIGRGVAAVPRAIKEYAKAKPTTLASGLEKPLAAEVPTTLTKLAKQTPGMQEKSLEQLGSQAEGILEKIKQKVPSYSKFAEGFEFEKYHEKIFDDVKNLAKGYTKPLKTNSITNFQTTTKNELEKIPNPTLGQKKSLKQINSFLVNPKNKLEDLLNVYRNLNSEIGDISVTQMTRGKMSDYRKFLDNYKDKIVETFKSDLGPNKFNKLFETANKSYTEYQNILDLEQKLKPITGDKLEFSDYKKLANNRLAPQLKKIVGKEITNDIQTLARDVLEVKDVLKSVKAKDFLTNTEKLGGTAVFLLNSLIPGLPIPATSTLFGIKAVAGAGRYGLGYILTKPSRLKNFREAMKSAKKLDFPGFKTAIIPIIRDMESEEETLD